MSERLYLLHLEDDPDYAHYVRDVLAVNNVSANVIWVSDRKGFEAALAERKFDLIVADYSLPDITGVQALSLALEQAPDTPFVLLSGTIGEQAAIESLRAGATDYVLKQWPDRLVPAVRRAVAEARERLRRQRAETELVRREKYLRSLTENSLDLLTILAPDASVIYNSPSLTHVLGYAQHDLDTRSVYELTHPEDAPVVRAAIEQLLRADGATRTMRLRIRHLRGDWVHLEAVVQNRLNDPDICGFIVNSRDVSEQVRAEADLRDNERQYRLLFQDNPDPIWVFDQESLVIVEVNDAAIQQYGYSREEFLLLKATDLRPGEDGPAFFECLDTFRKAPQPAGLARSSVWRHRHKNGEIVVAEVKWTQMKFRGRPAVLSLAHDITRRIRAEQRDGAMARLGRSLNSATSQLEAARIIKNIADELFGWDAFTLFLGDLESKRVVQVLAVDTINGEKVELPFDPALAVMSPRTQRVLANGAELILNDDPAEQDSDAYLLGDKSRRSMSLMYAPVRNGQRAVGVMSVQSYKPRLYDQHQLSLLQVLADHCGGALERIRAEEKSRETEQRFRDLFDGSPDAIFVEDESGDVLDVNPAACRLHGCSREELIGKNVLDLVPPDRQREVQELFARLISGELTRVEGESWSLDGRAVPVEVRAGRIHYGGSPALLLHVRDITERRHAEKALRSSELLFYSVWENSVDGMRLTDENGRIVAVNEAYCRLVGMKRQQLEGQYFTISLANADAAAALLAEYRASFPQRRVQSQTEARLTLRHGGTVVLEQTSSFVEIRGQPPLMLALFQDVTAQKQLQEQLRQSQKLEAIGQLAGGVAHDFNNILTVIHGHASLLLTGGALEGVTTRSAQQIVHAAERAAGLTRQLLTFSRRQVMQARPLDFNEVVSGMTRMLARILGEDIALDVCYATRPAVVMADQSMLEQVLLNLAVNARDAMPKGGELAVIISIESFDGSRAGRHPEVRTGHFVCLTVRDTGCGIEPANLNRIFEPFFTTKAKGKGTGLGLATVYGIVKQHQGWVEVESVVARGTNFRVFLPFLHAASPVTGTALPDFTTRGGSETILLVEDEKAVREMAASLLKGFGYEVVEAESGVRALEVWEDHRTKVDLLLTDIVMPGGINGRELAELLRDRSPALKVIYTSGYSAEVLGEGFVMQPGLNYLQKPYHPHRLAQMVRECLDECPAEVPV